MSTIPNYPFDPSSSVMDRLTHNYFHGMAVILHEQGDRLSEE